MSNATPVRKRKALKVLLLWNREVPEPAPDEVPDVVPEVVDDAAEDAAAPVPPAVHTVSEALRACGLDACDLDAEDEVERIADALRVERPALVLHMVDAFYGDATQQAAVVAYLDLLGVPVAGSDPQCLATCQDRVRTHLLLADAGIPVPGFRTIRDVNAIPAIEDLQPPLIVTQALDDIYELEGLERPLYEWDELVERVAELTTEYELPFLLEEYVAHRRVHALVVGNRSLEVLPLIELSEDEDEETAQSHEDAGPEPAEPEPAEPEPEPAWTLAQVDHDTADRIRELARRAFRVLGCRDFAQIDFHLDTEGNPYVVDVRPALDLGPEGPFYTAAESTDRGFAGTLAAIVRLVCERAHIEGDESSAPVIELPPAAPAQPEDEGSVI